MNCQMAAWVYSDDPEAQDALKRVEAWMEEVEQALSRFRPESDLSRLNAAAGRPYRAGDILWQVTLRALEAAEFSGGAFDPAIGQALINAGYDRSFEQIASERFAENHGAPAPVQEGREPPTSFHASGFSLSHLSLSAQIRLDPASRTITLAPGARLDLGGIAKGWAADRALDMLRPFGPAMIDAGGDLAIGDAPPAATGWPIGVTDPLAPESDLLLLRLAHVGVATSGTDHRRWWIRGRQQHHLIAPHTGAPAQTDILSATAIAANATQADVIALILVVLGLEAAQHWLQQHPHIPALLVLNDGRSYQTQSLVPYVETPFPIYA